MASLVSQTFCFLCALVFLLQCNLAQGIKLNDDGGYEIVIALEEGTPVPEIGAESYVSNIKVVFQRLLPELLLHYQDSQKIMRGFVANCFR